jgi:regulatory protein
MTKDDPERRMRRLAGMLARKGYGSGVAYQAIREELADLDAEGLFGNPDFD